VCVCVCVCIYIYIYIYIHTHTHTHKHTRTHNVCSSNRPSVRPSRTTTFPPVGFYVSNILHLVLPLIFVDTFRFCKNKTNFEKRPTYINEISLRPVFSQPPIMNAALVKYLTKKGNSMVSKKQSRNGPGVAQSVPGGLGSQIFKTLGTLPS